MMKGEIVNSIFNPKKKDDWLVVETNLSLYTLRLGGYRKETGSIPIDDFEELVFPYKGCKIKEVYTDDFWVFILLDNGGIISFGEMDINFSEEITLGPEFERVEDFDKGFFETDDLFKLVTGRDGWSVKQK